MYISYPSCAGGVAGVRGLPRRASGRAVFAPSAKKQARPNAKKNKQNLLYICPVSVLYCKNCGVLAKQSNPRTAPPPARSPCGASPAPPLHPPHTRGTKVTQHRVCGTAVFLGIAWVVRVSK